MRAFIASLHAIALSLGGPGLLVVAFMDSSFLSLPQVNDLLVVLMVTQNKSWMPYYALMATLGSIGGSYAIYYLANRGGDAFLRRRLASGHVDRALGFYRRYGLLALIVPALLPPPAPFKLFVLAAGVAGVRPVSFVTAIAIARGVRYLALGVLAVYYGDAALDLMRTGGREVALWVVGGIVVLVAIFVIWRRLRRRRATAPPTTAPPTTAPPTTMPPSS